MTSFRPRPIDVEKPLFIVREELNEDETRSVPALATGMELHEENESHIRQAIIEAQQKRTRIQANIPTPIIKTVPGYDESIGLWDRPSDFIQVTPPVNVLFRDPLAGPSDYDLDSDDVQWLETINQNGVVQLREDDLELLIELFERSVARERLISFNHKNGETILPLEQIRTSIDELNKGFSPQMIESVYNYWLTKRKQFKRPLVLSLLPLPLPDDPSPLIAFRPRDKENRKRSRKSNKQVLQQLQQLRKELEVGRSLLEMIRKRERLKKDLLISKRKAFEIRYVQKSRQIEVQKRLNNGSVNNALFTLESSEEESSDFECEPVAEDFRWVEPSSDSPSEWDRFPPHIHNETRNPEGRSYWGKVRLDGVPAFRGRIRVGRGGRVFVDRASHNPLPPDHVMWY